MLKRLCKTVPILLIMGPTTIFSANTHKAELKMLADRTRFESLLLKVNAAPQGFRYRATKERSMLHFGRPITYRWDVHYLKSDSIFIQFTKPDSLRDTAIFFNDRIILSRGDKHISRMIRYRGVSRFLQESHFDSEISLLWENYDIELSEGESYIGRPVHGLQITPKYRGRPTISAKIDLQTGLLLYFEKKRSTKTDTISQVSQILHLEVGNDTQPPLSYQFDRQDSLNQRSSTGESYRNIAAFVADNDQTILVPKHVPAGFRVREVRRRSRRNHSFIHTLYGDGLSVISLFQGDSAGKSKSHKKKKRKHRRNVTAISGQKQQIHYSIVSSIPQEELELMAASFVPVGQQHEKSTHWFLYLACFVCAAAALVLFNRRKK